ncbi:MAG: hypothetical protein IPG94_25205 [Kineosporiaceae bacterium]|nr:hypothetical protein [Kineosporiaceae bacterium]
MIRTAESDDTGDGEESWFDNADKVCADVVSTRGSAPRAQSGNLDDDMALYSAWLADSTRAAASGLSRIGSTPSRATTLIRGLRQYSELSTEAATIYAGHPVFSQRLMDIMTEQTELTTTLSLGFTLAGARACASVVDF